MRKYILIPLAILLISIALSSCGRHCTSEYAAEDADIAAPDLSNTDTATDADNDPAGDASEAGEDGEPEPAVPPVSADYPEQPETAPSTSPDDFVLVTEYIPDISIDLRYATDNNFTGQVIYGFTDAYLRYGTVQKLAEAQASLRELGYSLKIWDAFRPTSAQWKLWEVCPDAQYVANPTKGYSSHSRGNTVDVTLVDNDGSDVPMPTAFDDFSPLADRDYSDITNETAVKNAELLEAVMKDAGFKPYSGEWWHFSDETVYPVDEDFTPT